MTMSRELLCVSVTIDDKGVGDSSEHKQECKRERERERASERGRESE